MTSAASNRARRHTLIRTVATVAGDATLGIAVSAACVWVIEAAALGLFLSFLIWLLGLIVWAALSQYALHPVLAIALSDHKLDELVANSARVARYASLSVGFVLDELQRRGVKWPSFTQS